MTPPAEELATSLAEKIAALQGPILVLGASGFVGANLFRLLLRHRADVFGTRSQPYSWRLEGLPEANVITADLLVEHNQRQLLDAVKPRTVFDCVAYGAYSFETDSELIYRTNVSLRAKLLELMRERGVFRYIHAGSSSEYGDNAAGPGEDVAPTPNSHYAVSKAAVAGLLHYYGKKLAFPCANLRLYSIYGPYEDSSRLIPTVVARGVAGELPPLVRRDISRDFVYVDDCCEAFLDAALRLSPAQYGESFNVGSGIKTTIGDVAALATELFGLSAQPEVPMENRDWDVSDWYANPAKTHRVLGWKPRTGLREGLAHTIAWYRALEKPEAYARASKRHGVDTVYSVTAIIACYKDGQAIPIMYRRLTDVFRKLNIDYEIIFVNDCSPDDSEEVIRGISASDRHVLGITHSRNFGSQAAFRSGMELATKNACVLLDGDLQDPPELIEAFVAKWREGHDVVYGRRVKRDASLFMQLAYKAFYRVFDAFSYIPIPRDAGDFSLITRKVMDSLLQFPERDLFIRGIRAFAGFKQVGVDYVRPERMFGRTTNSLLKNIGWAKKGILSFSNVPLNLVSAMGVTLFGVSILLGVAQIVLRLAYPELAPRGVTTTLLAIIFFGSINLLGISLLGEYVAKIFEEVKRRPHFIRRHVIRDGTVRSASDESLSSSRDER